MTDFRNNKQLQHYSIPADNITDFRNNKQLQHYSIPADNITDFPNPPSSLELITVRKSKSIVGHYTVSIEKNKSVHAMCAGLTKLKAIEVGTELAKKLKTELHVYSDHNTNKEIIKL